jgi:hypothetical protein
MDDVGEFFSGRAAMPSQGVGLQSWLAQLPALVSLHDFQALRHGPPHAGHGYVDCLQQGMMLHGWACVQSQYPDGMAERHQGLDSFRASGQAMGRPYDRAAEARF